MFRIFILLFNSFFFVRCCVARCHEFLLSPKTSTDIFIGGGAVAEGCFFSLPILINVFCLFLSYNLPTIHVYRSSLISLTVGYFFPTHSSFFFCFDFFFSMHNLCPSLIFFSLSLASMTLVFCLLCAQSASICHCCHQQHQYHHHHQEQHHHQRQAAAAVVFVDRLSKDTTIVSDDRYACSVHIITSTLTVYTQHNDVRANKANAAVLLFYGTLEI